LIKLVIVDDHALVRMGILRLLDDCPDLCVVGEASSGDEALFLVKNHNPDVLILDMKMPGMDGWEVTRRLKQMNAHVKIIVLSAHSSQPFPTRVLQMGAMGYLSKESAMDEMVIAIRQVARGERYVSAKIAQQMAFNSLSTEEGSPFDRLSEREMQVLLMLAKGLSVSLIAKTLFLSSKTVNGYRYRMFEKLNIKNDVELIFLAMKHGVIQQPTVVE
jgi:two-component system invasion response regulator UvrY